MFSIVILFASVWGIAHVHVPRYTNMTDQQYYAESDRYMEAQFHACQQAGGSWNASFASAGCSVEYDAPDTSWYVTPIQNSLYDLWELFIFCTALIALIGTSWGFLYALIELPTLCWELLKRFRSKPSSDFLLESPYTTIPLLENTEGWVSPYITEKLEEDQVVVSLPSHEMKGVWRIAPYIIVSVGLVSAVFAAFHVLLHLPQIFKGEE